MFMRSGWGASAGLDGGLIGAFIGELVNVLRATEGPRRKGLSSCSGV